MILERHAHMRLAIELIARHTRLSIVHHETGLPRQSLRELYREYHGVSAPSGQLPALGGAMIGTRREQIQATLFAALYQHCGGHRLIRSLPGPRSRSLYAAIEAHDQCQSLLGATASLGMTRCWVVSCDLQVGAAHLLGCLTCEVPYLIADQLRFNDACPICALYRAPRRPSTLQPHRDTQDEAFARALLLPEERGFQRWQGQLRRPPTRGRYPPTPDAPRARPCTAAFTDPRAWS